MSVGSCQVNVGFTQQSTTLYWNVRTVEVCIFVRWVCRYFHEGGHKFDEFVTLLDLFGKAYANVALSDVVDATSVRSRYSQSYGQLHYWYTFIKYWGLIDSTSHVLSHWIILWIQLSNLLMWGRNDWNKRCILSDDTWNNNMNKWIPVTVLTFRNRVVVRIISRCRRWFNVNVGMGSDVAYCATGLWSYPDLSDPSWLALTTCWPLRYLTQTCN